MQNATTKIIEVYQTLAIIEHSTSALARHHLPSRFPNDETLPHKVLFHKIFFIFCNSKPGLLNINGFINLRELSGRSSSTLAQTSQVSKTCEVY